jgi:hypothetical protein
MLCARKSYCFLQGKHEHIELPAKLLDYWLRSNKSNINQSQKLSLGKLAQKIIVQFSLIAVFGSTTRLRSTLSFPLTMSLALCSAWIPEDINAVIATCFVSAIIPFILTHTYWQ